MQPAIQQHTIQSVSLTSVHGWLKILSYYNPDTRCAIRPTDPDPLGYCWSYAHHVDKTPGYEDMGKICPGCEFYQEQL
jgi:hypothetical protein